MFCFLQSAIHSGKTYYQFTFIQVKENRGMPCLDPILLEFTGKTWFNNIQYMRWESVRHETDETREQGYLS